MITEIRAIAPTARGGLVGPLADAFDKYLPKYGIDTPLRKAHFMAQAACETDGFQTLEEYASGKEYEGRKDLGNVVKGDGVRYKGRGIFQLTGRVNYDAYGKRLKLDLVGDPEKAADPAVSVRVACEYWKAKGLNAWADRDDVVTITRRINGGQNGLATRKRYLAKAKTVYGADEAPVAGLLTMPSEEVPDAPIAAEPPKGMLKSKEGLASLGIGGFTAADVGQSVHDRLLDKISDLDWLDKAQVLLSDARVQFGLVVIVLAVAIWFWRHQRMHEDG